VQHAHAESLICPIPPSSAVCARTTSTASSAAFACLAIRAASATIVIQDRGGDEDHHDAEDDPHVQPAAAVTIADRLLQRSLGESSSGAESCPVTDRSTG
jgi:hypothetical protein